MHGPFGALLKFAGASAFGCLTSLVLFIAAFWIDDEVFWGGWWHHLLWIIPLLWGALGVLWFEPMLKAAKAVFDAAFNIDE